MKGSDLIIKAHHTPEKKLEIVIDSYQIGLFQTEKLYNVTKKTIIKWRKQYQDEGYAGLAKNNRLINRVRKISDSQKIAILELCAEHPQISNREIIEKLKLNCSNQTVLKIRRQITENKSVKQISNCWHFNYFKLSCTIDNKPVYLLTATEIKSGVTLFALVEENISSYLNAFVEYILLFLKSVGKDSDLKITAKSSRFVSKHISMEYRENKSKVEKLQPDLIRRKINTLSSGYSHYRDLLTTLDYMFLNMNVELMLNKLQTDDWELLKFQPVVITLNDTNGDCLQKKISQVSITLIKMVKAEIAKFNLSKAKNLLNFITKIELLLQKSQELQIVIQLLWGDIQLHTYDNSKALYHYTKAIKLAEISGCESLKIEADIAIAGLFLITSHYRKCENVLNNALRLSRDLKLKKTEGDILAQLGYLYKLTNDTRAYTVAEWLMEIAITEDDKELYCKYLNLNSTILFSAGLYEKGFSYAQKSLNLAKKHNLPPAVFEANYNIAEYGLRVDNFTLAEECLLANQNDSFKSNNYSSDDVKNLIRLGLIKCQLNELKTGLDILEKCRSLAKKRNDRFSESLTLNHFGQVYFNKQDYKKSAFYFKKAAKICELIGNKEQLMIIYGCLSTCYSKMQQCKKALLYAHKKLDEVKNTKNRIQIASVYGIIGFNAIANKELDMALKYYKLQFKILKPTDADLHKVQALANIGIIHRRKQNYSLAELYLKKAEKKLISFDNNQYLSQIYLGLAKIAKATGKVEKLKEYVRLAKEKAGLAGDNVIVDMAEELLKF